MITEKTLKSYEFDSMDDYFQYIVQSRNNGQHKQARELFFAMSEGMQGQRADFFEYVGDDGLRGLGYTFVGDWKKYLGVDDK
jgi:hypothetical protein